MRVQVRNTMYDRRSSYAFEIPEFNYYDGDEVNVKWVKPFELALSTGNTEFPFRVIQRAHIVSIDGNPVRYKQEQPKTLIVKGSKGEDYIVTLGPKPSCTCTGFQFRKTCKHINS